MRAKDESTNIGLFSDSVFIECFKPGGNWSFGGYDSIQEFAMKDPKGADKYLADNVKGYK